MNFTNFMNFQPINVSTIQLSTKLIILLVFFGVQQLAAQNSIDLVFIPSDYDSLKFIEDFKMDTKVTNESELYSLLNNLLKEIHKKSFIIARIDSVVFNHERKKSFIYIKVGNQYQWAKLSPGNIEDDELSKSGFREKLFYKKTFNYTELSALSEKIILTAENYGYPFASLTYDSLGMDENSISLRINLQKNRQVIIDSLVLHGNLKITERFLHSYLGINVGMLYNESVVSQIDKKLKDLPYVKITKPIELEFTPYGENKGKARIHVFADSKPANQLDGIVGLLPNNGNEQKLKIFGEGHIKIQNLFGSGKMVELKWRKLDFKTQDLKSQFYYPFVLGTPFSMNLELFIFKKDTTYIDIDKKAEVAYLLNSKTYLKGFVSSKSSNLLSVNGLSKNLLPDYADITSTIYGLGYGTENLDYSFNPRSGYVFELESGAGNKIISKNDYFNEEVYENIDFKSVQLNTRFKLQFYFPLKSRSVIMAGAKSGWIFNENLFGNELFRIGGHNLLRGFDEESINASGYSIATLEYRYLIGENSYLNLFADGGYYENKAGVNIENGFPAGIGAGTSFETKAGFFSISYALGSINGAAPDIRNSKVHFGLVSYF